jgi:VWFA-related protein
MTVGTRAPVLVAVLCGGTVALAQDPVFRARVEGVRIDALVTEDGRPVNGLQPGDFEVRDNGVLQSIDLVSLGDVAVDIVLTLDVSQSVQGPKLAALTRAAGSLLDALGPDDTAALMTFNWIVERRVRPTKRLDEIRSALVRLEAIGDTALVDAALGALLVGDADGGRTLLVVFSDGVDTASYARPELVLDETARRVNGVVYGVSSSGDEARFLRDLAAATGGRVIDIGKTGDPGPTFLDVLQEFRRRYVITFTPAGVTRGGWHTLDVRVKRPRVRVQARPGYFSTEP